MKLNTTAIATAIRAASGALGKLDSEKARYKVLVLELQRLFGDSDRETVKAHVCECVAKRGEYTEGTWAKEAGTSKKRANRIILSVMGATESAKVKVDKALVKQIAALLAEMETKVLNATIAAVKVALQ
jgi:hypothetical protein